MQSAQKSIVNRSPVAVRPAAVAAASKPAGVQCQSLSKTSSASDPAEKEAVQTAQKVMRMAAPAAAPATERRLEPSLQRFAGSVQLLHRAGTSAGAVPVAANVASEINAAQGSGQPLPLSVRRFMEPRFNANFSGVRIHTGEQSAKLNRAVQAQAFTVGQQVFFGKGQFQPETPEGKELIAHELTHTIQQGAVVQRSSEAAVTQSSAPQVQRLGVSDALDYFADKANLIPGFRMFTIVLGVNPINMSGVDRSAANILRAIVEFIPGGGLVTQALDAHGVFDKVGAWVEQQLKGLGLVGSAIKQAISQFLDSLSWTDIFDLGGVWSRAKRIFTGPIEQIITLARGLITGILRFIREAILRPLGKLAEGTAGYDLLKAVLGFDPVTGDAVPRTADALIGGFMKLIGQEEVYRNLKQGKALERAYAWFQGAMAGVIAFAREIPGKVVEVLTSLTIADVVTVVGAFAKVGRAFAGIAGRFISWAGSTVLDLLEILFSVVAPGVIGYIKKARGAFASILKNPIGFVGNLVRAGKGGFLAFARNIGKHLQAALISWLTGAMAGAGLYIPTALNLREIIKFVLSVLGLTWANIRVKLVKAVGETAVKAMETGFDLVSTLVTQGPAAAWEKIKEGIANLQDTVIGGIRDFVVTKVVEQAVVKLVSMLNPAGAIIQAIIATYNTVMFFVERIRQIAAVVGTFIDSIAAIASGAIGGAIARVESTLAGLLNLAINFLARFAGLGKVSDAVMGIINKLRAPIDKALDKVVEWLVAAARKLGRFVAQAGVPNDPKERLRLAARAAVLAAKTLKGRVTKPLLETTLAAVRVRYGLTQITVYEQAKRWWVRAVINPDTVVDTGVATGDKQGADLSQLDAIVRPMPTTVVLFKINLKKFNPVSYRGQLRQQEQGINASPMRQWQANRQQYLTLAAGPAATGRSEASADDQATFRKEIERRIVAQRQKPPINETLAQAEAYASNWMASRAALHGPDQVAGGGRAAGDAGKAALTAASTPAEFKAFKERTGLVGMGGARVNSSVGSQWAKEDSAQPVKRVELLDAGVRAYEAAVAPKLQAVKDGAPTPEAKAIYQTESEARLAQVKMNSKLDAVEFTP